MGSTPVLTGMLNYLNMNTPEDLKHRLQMRIFGKLTAVMLS
jgi:hypothetical protein